MKLVRASTNPDYLAQLESINVFTLITRYEPVEWRLPRDLRMLICRQYLFDDSVPRDLPLLMQSWYNQGTRLILETPARVHQSVWLNKEIDLPLTAHTYKDYWIMHLLDHCYALFLSFCIYMSIMIIFHLSACG